MKEKEIKKKVRETEKERRKYIHKLYMARKKRERGRDEVRNRTGERRRETKIIC